MFQVRVYSQNTRLVKMIRDTLPDAETDPPEPSEIKGLTPEDLIREVFSVCKHEIQREITAQGGEWTIGRLGVWLNQRNGWADRWAAASLGKKGTKVVLEALGLRVSAEQGPGAKVQNP